MCEEMGSVGGGDGMKRYVVDSTLVVLLRDTTRILRELVLLECTHGVLEPDWDSLSCSQKGYNLLPGPEEPLCRPS